jgi:hypothetical protein
MMKDMSDMIIPTYEDMLAAHERITPHIRRTPILTLEYERGRSPSQCWAETREAILAVIRGETGTGS